MFDIGFYDEQTVKLDVCGWKDDALPLEGNDDEGCMMMNLRGQ